MIDLLLCYRHAASSALILAVSAASLAGGADAPTGLFAKKNLVAWCVVPFDAKNRRPFERAEMLQALGFTKLAYDWRDQHVPDFDEEVRQCQSHGIEFFAFWGWHDRLPQLIHRRHIHPQIWMMAPSPEEKTDEAKIEAAARALAPLVDRTRSLELKLGLYNHDGWGGEPANLVAICKKLRSAGNADHVGIVYNFHHGHAHIGDFAESLALMKPYLLCLNINGMNDDGDPLVLPIGSGQHEQQMLRTVLRSGYHGPIGILHHREQIDAEVGLRENLAGLKQVLESLGDLKDAQTFGP